MKLLTRKRHFRHRMSMLVRVIIKDQNFVFGSKIGIYAQNWKFRSKMTILAQRGPCWLRIRVLSQKSPFRQKNSICLINGHFGSKLGILAQNWNFVAKNLVSKLGILAQNWSFVSWLANFSEKTTNGAQNDKTLSKSGKMAYYFFYCFKNEVLPNSLI